MMFVLGIHGALGGADLDAAAVLVYRNRIIAAAEEERFLRYKGAVGIMPTFAIHYVLAEAGIDMHRVDIVAVPRAMSVANEKRFEAYLWYQFGYVPPIEFIDHDTAHAASAYLVSGFDQSLIVTVDQSGSGLSAAVFRGAAGKLQPVEAVLIPDFIGLDAAVLTQCGGYSHHDAHKSMGSAADSVPHSLYPSRIFADDLQRSDIAQPHQKGLYRHGQFHPDQPPIVTAAAFPDCAAQRLADGSMSHANFDMASATQTIIGVAVADLVREHQASGDTQLCVAGSVMQNSVAAGKVFLHSGFDDIYAAPACGEAGTALGAALVVATENGSPPPSRLDHTQFGPGYADRIIENLLRECAIAFTIAEDPSDTAAELLQRGAVVAWFQGRMEFGPQALGARSLLADPSVAGMRERVNSIKGRPAFQPFGVSVLAEHVGELFGRNGIRSPFMSFTLPTTHDVQIQAASHVDTTSRPHTVPPGSGRYRRLIERFHQRTGVPAVLNTGLTSGCEPIISTPDQALAFFYSHPADALILGSFVVTKQR